LAQTGTRPLRLVALSGAEHAPETLAVLLGAGFFAAEHAVLAAPLVEACERVLAGGADLAQDAITLACDGALVDGFDDVAAIEAAVLLERARAAMQAGVRLRDPSRTYIRGTLTCGAGVTIDADVIVEGDVVLGDGVRVDAHCVLSGSRVGEGTWIKAFSIVEDAAVASRSVVGPYARLRPGTILGERCQIGNFVEIKSSTIGDGARINHHSFVGDAVLEEAVTLGAGCITCNHDGTKTNATFIGRGAYVGSGCQLVAPVRIGRGATIGAGSTITRDVPDATLAVARARQATIGDWRGPRSNRDET
jgi:bifunctional UDP-N-acetylglucosamine pyrophosphorylase/glucosamine-1-phosphate N-acetyltransferase